MSIDSFVEGLTGRTGEAALPETKRRARLALTSFTEFLAERGKSWPDETDYETFKSIEPDNTTTRQRMSYIRRYYEERSNNTAMVENDNTTTLNTEKKKQVSVYLERDTYETLKVLAQATSTSIGDILSNCATRIAKKNVANGVLEQATTALKALSNITLEYSE